MSRGGMFLLGCWNVFLFSPRTGCGHVNHPGGKSEGPHTHLLVLVFIKKKKKDEDNNLCGLLKRILIINEQGKSKPLEQAGMWPGDLRRQAPWGCPSPCHLGPSAQSQPTHGACVRVHGVPAWSHSHGVCPPPIEV